MLNLSIMPLFEDSVEAACEDMIRQQREGISTCAMMMMTFNAEGTPPVEKAEQQCRIYDLYRERLDKAGARHGVLVQATMGHITLPYAPHPFQTTVSVIDGKESGVTCCPLDPGFRAYMKEQMRILATHKPGAVMIDDDVAMLYRDTRGCACHRHMAEFNRRAGTNMTRQELYEHITGSSPEDQQYAQLYVDVQRESLVDFVKCIREGINEVDPTVQGIVSGIYVSTFCEFSGEVGNAFAGKGNPVIVRYNGGPYAKPGPYGFTSNVFRAAILRENLKDQVDIFLAETDTITVTVPAPLRCTPIMLPSLCRVRRAQNTGSRSFAAGGRKPVRRIGGSWRKTRDSMKSLRSIPISCSPLAAGSP